VEIDWGDGDYSRTAAVLAPAAEDVVEAARVADGDWVLDVASGTGNAALAASARGASVVGVDLSGSLVDLARARAARAGAEDVTFLVGDAGALPVEAGAFDAAVSVFGVIFALDPERAMGQMLAAVRPGGAIVLASWLGRGPVDAAGRILRGAMRRGGGDDDAPPVRWDDPAWVAELVGAAGGREVTQQERALTAEADSPEEWFADQERHHPVWRLGRRAMAPERWEAVRAETVAALRAGSEERGRFRAAMPWLLTRAVR
jgi:ubiquinone/menaquinone biosynthesis C-methylase UbiE